MKLEREGREGRKGKVGKGRLEGGEVGNLGFWEREEEK
jgi:hypothetical protein